MRNHTFILHQEEANPRSVFSLLQLHSNDNVSAKQQPEVVAFTQSQSCGAELINSAAEKILHSATGFSPINSIIHPFSAAHSSTHVCHVSSSVLPLLAQRLPLSHALYKSCLSLLIILVTPP